MQYIQIILESNSNLKLDTLSKEIIKAIKQTGAVKSGPIALKNKRLIYCYNYNHKTIDRLISVPKKLMKGIVATVNPLEKST
jgi:ribosomal protein S10